MNDHCRSQASNERFLHILFPMVHPVGSSSATATAAPTAGPQPDLPMMPPTVRTATWSAVPCSWKVCGQRCNPPTRPMQPPQPATNAPRMAAPPPGRRERRAIRARHGNRQLPPALPRIAVAAAPPGPRIAAIPDVATRRKPSHRPAATTDLGTGQRDGPAAATAAAATATVGAAPPCAAVIAVVAGRGNAHRRWVGRKHDEDAGAAAFGLVPTQADAGQSRLR